jgi:hypothetical protein
VPQRPAALWADLTGADAERAFRAARALLRSPGKSARLLRKRVRPVVVAADERLVARHIADLDSEELAVREKATAALEQLDEQAGAALRQALRAPLSLELRRRIERLVRRLEAPLSGEMLGALRAVEVLERMASPEARALLADLAKGARGARLTEAAKSSLGRLNR